MKGISNATPNGSLFHISLFCYCCFAGSSFFAHFNHQINALILVFEFNNSYAYERGLCCVCCMAPLQFLKFWLHAAVLSFSLSFEFTNTHARTSFAFSFWKWFVIFPSCFFPRFLICALVEKRQIWKENKRKARSLPLSGVFKLSVPVACAWAWKKNSHNYVRRTDDSHLESPNQQLWWHRPSKNSFLSRSGFSSSSSSSSPLCGIFNVWCVTQMMQFICVWCKWNSCIQQ